MAIYHFSAQIISRGKGQAAVAAASYRSGEKLLDERTGEVKSYKREVQPETMILAPKNAPGWVHDRERLWNEVEKIEKNKNSQLSREINVALPVELSNEQQRELIKNFAQEQFVDRGMVADISIHRDDKANPHAHIMLTVRQFDEDGQWGNKKRKDYELDQDGNKIPDKNGKPKYTTVSLTDWDKKENLVQWREEWANHANKALEREGSQERISHLSHESRGLEQLPTVHLGHVNHEMEKRGVETVRGDLNRERQEYNNLVVDLQKYREEKEAITVRQLEQPSKNDELLKAQFKVLQEFLDKEKNSQLEKPIEPKTEHFFLPQEQTTEIQKELIEKFRKEFEGKIDVEKPIEEQIQHAPEAQQLYTHEEQNHLQVARKILKTELSLENIQDRHKQIDKWEIRVNNGEQYNNWKDQTMKEAAKHFQVISSDQKRIQEQQKRLEDINWLNPLKLKENRTTKEQAENIISSCEKDTEMYEKKLNYHREKLEFKTETQFKQVQSKHEIEKPELREKSRNQRKQIHHERDALKNAEIAIKRGVIRKVAAKYPELPEMRYMDYKTAIQIEALNEGNGRVVTVEEIKTTRDQHKSKLQGFEQKIKFVETEKVRMKRTEGYLNEVKKYSEIVDKYEKKLFHSKSSKQEYEDALVKRDYYKKELQQGGVSDRGDWNNQSSSLEKLDANVPFIQSQAQPVQRTLSILDAVMQGIEQAGRETQRQQRRQEQSRRKGKGKLKGHSLEDQSRER